jgi:3-deoxy-7-phosphoheptulonate synthase
VSPSHGIGDDPKQALTPEVLTDTFRRAKLLWAMNRK